MSFVITRLSVSSWGCSLCQIRDYQHMVLFEMAKKRRACIIDLLTTERDSSIRTPVASDIDLMNPGAYLGKEVNCPLYWKGFALDRLSSWFFMSVMSPVSPFSSMSSSAIRWYDVIVICGVSFQTNYIVPLSLFIAAFPPARSRDLFPFFLIFTLLEMPKRGRGGVYC